MPRRKCFIVKYTHSFLVEWQGAARFELPKAVVALAAAAVRDLDAPLHITDIHLCKVDAALVDFKSGSLYASDFLADSFDSVYTAHFDVLRSISRLEPLAYHNLMVDLYDHTMYVIYLLPYTVTDLTSLQWL